MKKTVLITGTSSGIGRAAVRYFSAQGWQVAATMRSPAEEIELRELPGVRVYALDVTVVASIETTLQQVLEDFGAIDVVVNNAGYGTIGVFEKATDEQVRRQFETNVFGVMNLIRAVLPLFRAKKSGTIITVTSMGGLVTFPLYSVYHATKWALEGFLESLAFEVRQFNIVIKNIEPGAIKTDFYGRSRQEFENAALTAYEKYEQRVRVNLEKAVANGSSPEAVAQTIYAAATDASRKLRYPTGGNARSILLLRKLLPDRWFFAVVRKTLT